jgi:signal transduction histidine kinase
LVDLGRGIYPRALREGGLSAALGELGAVAAPAVRVSVPLTQERWPPEVEGAVYFTCAEVVQNAVKHAHADRIDVRLRMGDDGLTFEVSDDGVGIDQGPTTMGTGLRGLAERVEALGGWIRVSTTPGHGTTVTGSVPLHAIGV